MDAATTAYVKEQIDLEFQRFKNKASPPDDFAPMPDIPAGRYIEDEF